MTAFLINIMNAYDNEVLNPLIQEVSYKNLVAVRP